MSCIYTTEKERNKCSILNVSRCIPEKCIWRRSVEDYLQSLHKAKLNYIKTHGTDDYLKHVPTPWVERFIKYEENDGKA